MKPHPRPQVSPTHNPIPTGTPVSRLLLAVGVAVSFAISSPAQVLTRPQAPGKSAPAPVKPSRQGTTTAFDYSGIGGSVYTTGLGEVTVTVHSEREFLSDAFYPYETTVYAVIDGKEVLLGSNKGKTRTLQLGQLKRGEIRLRARCDAGSDRASTFESGPGSRNSDGAPHSRVRQVRPGVIEVYFENTMDEGKRNDKTEQHWYKDFKMTLTGAVTRDSGLMFVLDRVNDSDPVTRDSARTTLKEAYPELAAKAGVR